MEQNFREKSKQNALKDSSRTITFGELDTISGKIYSFLRSRNIGREDVVLINLPRSLSVVCAMVGVLRSGAAYIVMDAGDPVEKVKYAFNESQSKLLLDADIYTQMMNAEPAAGYEKREPHDLAYVIYTFAFQDKNYGYASAVAICLLVVILLIHLIQTVCFKEKDEVKQA